MESQPIYLIGSTNFQLMDYKLLLQRDCMRVLFYTTRFSKTSLLESAKLVMHGCLSFWKKSSITLKNKSDYMKKNVQNI